VPELKRVGVEAGRSGGTCRVVEADGPVLAGLLLFLEEEAHGDAHPEELGRLEPARALAGLVDDEVAVVHRLDAEKSSSRSADGSMAAAI